MYPNPEIEKLRKQQEQGQKKLEQLQHREQQLQNRIWKEPNAACGTIGLSPAGPPLSISGQKSKPCRSRISIPSWNWC